MLINTLAFMGLLAVFIITYVIVSPKIENDESWLPTMEENSACSAGKIETAFAVRYFETVGLIGGIFGPIYGLIIQRYFFDRPYDSRA